jgi:hypothetical protein
MNNIKIIQFNLNILTPHERRLSVLFSLFYSWRIETIDWIDIITKIHTNIHTLELSLLQTNQELLVSVHEVWNQHARDEMNNR